MLNVWKELIGKQWLRVIVFAWGAGLSALSAQSQESASILRLATTTSARDTGLLDALLPRFEEEVGYTVQLASVGTGAALRMARAGKVDVLIVHSPKSERKFVEEGFGTKRYPLMRNDFIVLGPATDPAGVAGLGDVIKVFESIAKRPSMFVSRGDDSGTNKKELEIWQGAGVEPVGCEWYLELGTGISGALEYASQHAAYLLADRGTWLTVEEQSKLIVISEGDPLLFNPYSVIPVDPAKHVNAYINSEGAQSFVDWITAEAAQTMIGEFRVNGERLFVPAIDEGQTPAPAE